MHAGKWALAEQDVMEKGEKNQWEVGEGFFQDECGCSNNSVWSGGGECGDGPWDWLSPRGNNGIFRSSNCFANKKEKRRKFAKAAECLYIAGDECRPISRYKRFLQHSLFLSGQRCSVLLGNFSPYRWKKNAHCSLACLGNLFKGPIPSVALPSRAMWAWWGKGEIQWPQRFECTEIWFQAALLPRVGSKALITAQPGYCKTSVKSSFSPPTPPSFSGQALVKGKLCVNPSLLCDAFPSWIGRRCKAISSLAVQMGKRILVTSCSLLLGEGNCLCNQCPSSFLLTFALTVKWRWGGHKKPVYFHSRSDLLSFSCWVEVWNKGRVLVLYPLWFWQHTKDCRNDKFPPLVKAYLWLEVLIEIGVWKWDVFTLDWCLS